MKTPVRMPPQSQWFTHLYRDKTTKLTHAVICLKRNFKRKPGSRANCAALIEGMWPRGLGDGITCPKCLGIYNALDYLLEDA